jgi:hypothetical protein
MSGSCCHAEYEQKQDRYYVTFPSDFGVAETCFLASLSSIYVLHFHLRRYETLKNLKSEC